jgi:hypothetical protein
MIEKYFKSLDEEFEDYKIIYNREKEIEKKVIETFPKDINAKITFDDLGKTCIKCILYLEDGINELEYNNICNWLEENFSENIRKFLRENEGKFSTMCKSKTNDDIGAFELIFLIENTPKLNCKLVEKEITKVIYEAECN